MLLQTMQEKYKIFLDTLEKGEQWQICSKELYSPLGHINKAIRNILIMFEWLLKMSSREKEIKKYKRITLKGFPQNLQMEKNTKLDCTFLGSMTQWLLMQHGWDTKQ